MVLPLAAAALPILGATLGGIEGYRQSGGNLGAAALGAGLGAAVPKGLRMAGSALAATPLGAKIAPGLYKGAKALGLGGPSSLIGAEAQRRAGAALIPGAAAALGVAPAAYLLAGGLAGGVARGAQAAQPLAGQAAQTALGYGIYRPTEVDYGANLPSYDPSIVGQYGGIPPVGSPTDILGPLGIGRSLETQRQAKADAEAMRLLGTEQMRFTEAAKRKDFERQAAMKGIAQNIMTQAAMLQGAQQAAINMGQTGMEGVSRGLTQLYQYQ